MTWRRQTLHVFTLWCRCRYSVSNYNDSTLTQSIPYTSLSHVALRSTLIGPRPGATLDRPGASRREIWSRPTSTSGHRVRRIYCYSSTFRTSSVSSNFRQSLVILCLTMCRETLFEPVPTPWPKLQRLTRPGPTEPDTIRRTMGVALRRFPARNQV